MSDEKMGNALKEVYEILQNTDEELLSKIPLNFIDFIKSNMNNEYKTNIKCDTDIDKQNLLEETESILALIYRSYWATEKEKGEFAIKDKEEKILEENKKKENIQNDIYKIFEKRNKQSNSLNNNLPVPKKEKLFRRILNKIKFFVLG